MFSKDYYHSCITLISTQATDKSLWLCGCYTERFCTFGYTMNPVWFLFECNIKSYSSAYKHMDWHKQSDRSSYAHVMWGFEVDFVPRKHSHIQIAGSIPNESFTLCVKCTVFISSTPAHSGAGKIDGAEIPWGESLPHHILKMVLTSHCSSVNWQHCFTQSVSH